MVCKLAEAVAADSLHNTAAVVADCTAGNSYRLEVHLAPDRTAIAAGIAGSSQLHLEEHHILDLAAGMHPAGHNLAAAAVLVQAHHLVGQSCPPSC